MKKLNIFKTIQLVVVMILTGVCLYMIVMDPDVFNYVNKNANVRTICSLLWVVLGLSFLFLFFDFCFFSSFKRDLTELDNVAHADRVAGIPNRYSCDTLIDKYKGKALPANTGCIMIDLTNIGEINKLYGRDQGDASIRAFSQTLHMVSAGLCFIGRNGGNKFVALFEDSSEEQLNRFTQRLDQKMESLNADPELHPITYKYGVAFYNYNKDISSITDLIALANKRIYTK